MGLDPESLLHVPGWVALVVTLYKSLIGQHGKRLEHVEAQLPKLQKLEDAHRERQELRNDLQRVEDNLGRKLDTLTETLLRRHQ